MAFYKTTDLWWTGNFTNKQVFHLLKLGLRSTVLVSFLFLSLMKQLMLFVFCCCFFSNWCFWTVVLKKTLESFWDCKEIQPVHPKGDQSWIFNGSTHAEAETPTPWPPDVKNWLIKKTLMLGKIESRRRRGRQRMRWLYGITDSMDMSLSKL